jgi:hypothetical protein
VVNEDNLIQIILKKCIFKIKRCALRKFTLLLFFSAPACINAQIVHSSVSATYPGLGAYSINHADVFSFHSNQAALAQVKNLSAGVYTERRFMLKELALYNASVVLPTHSGNFGLDTRYFGFADYNETQLGLAYGRRLGSKVDLGVQFNYYNVQIPYYGNASVVNFEAGAILHLTEKLNAGIHVYNPVGGKFGKDEQEKLSSVYSGGIGYEASDKFFISAEIEKEEDQPVNVNAGLQYKFLPQLLARGGISTATSSMYFGIGVAWKSVRLDVTTSYHQQLGITPGLMLIFNPDKQQE